MEDRNARLVRLGTIGLPLAAATLLTLFWPGPLALDDRIPLALVFGVPTVVVADRIRRALD